MAPIAATDNPAVLIKLRLLLTVRSFVNGDSRYEAPEVLDQHECVHISLKSWHVVQVPIGQFVLGGLGLNSLRVLSTHVQNWNIRASDRCVIHLPALPVAASMNTIAPLLRRPDTPTSLRHRAMVPSFGCCASAEGMIQTRKESAIQPDHVALIEAIAQQRDRAAFTALFGYFGPRVKAWMLSAGTSLTAAEELVQETMLTVWQKARLFDPSQASPSTWIFTIARNQRIDLLRRERHPSTLMAGWFEEPEVPLQADSVLDMAQQETRIRLALGKLPSEQAEVIWKAFFEDKVHAEIERELGIPLGTIKSRLRLAISRLRRMLGDLK
jgi:RNA polymerase sigma-70 factor (ECF subfamily)